MSTLHRLMMQPFGVDVAKVLLAAVIVETLIQTYLKLSRFSFETRDINATFAFKRILSY